MEAWEGQEGPRSTPDSNNTVPCGLLLHFLCCVDRQLGVTVWFSQDEHINVKNTEADQYRSPFQGNREPQPQYALPKTVEVTITILASCYLVIAVADMSLKKTRGTELETYSCSGVSYFIKS
ncbi:hypothetical protein llap_5821 [Limosa lapponica baueri]|uniref:Uncharacterized protein n=1 Tax=Limosa lapponica baueri TaxID=1758121 RepID=A0A2I0UCW2_LIMLA|nr:hypothetical protein llap_5821 [Limosa lapponica baueri]